MNGSHASASHPTQISYPHAHPHAQAGPSSQPMESMQSSSSSGHMSGSVSSCGQPKFSNGPHIRSRITVVCAECKRLKLKCDRRTPCSSCLKRDTVQRCVYSQAAAEKIDVQSLHNRILVLEGLLAKISEAPTGTSVQSVLGNMGFKAPFGNVGMSMVSHSSAGISNGNHVAGPSISNDRALLATGAGGSSVVISLDDVASIWLSEFDDIPLGPSNALSDSPSAPRVKVEPMPVLLPTPPTASSSLALSSLPRFVPPVPYAKFLPASEMVGDTHVTNGGDLFPAFAPNSQLPQVTPELLKHLPPKERRTEIMQALEETMVLHPCFHVGNWVKRVEAMFTWAEGGSLASPVQGTDQAFQARQSTASSMRELAREVFFGAPPGKKTKVPPPKPTLSFFASACAGLALGALVASKGNPNPLAGSSAAGAPSSRPASQQSSRPGSSSAEDDEPGEVERCSAAALFALSEQALSYAERTASYDVDSVVAMLLQVLYQLHFCPGGTSVQQGVFPLVGKMINIARTMGLASDPDEFPGTYSLFDAETRRRVWWDVFYYDLFISDCMGHPPLIPDNSFTTRLPADVDEDAFGPSSTVLPVPPETLEGTDKGTTYFSLKCRLAQLVKNVKKQTFKDPLSDDPNELSIDQAAMYENDITTFLAELPPSFRLELNHDWSDPIVSASFIPTDAALLAQKCELSILANRLILKLYLPFLKDTHTGAGRNQAVLGTLNAAHAIIYASKMLHAVWANTRPAAFDFYDFGRALFDAAVVCAHAVVQQPAGMLAGEAMKDVTCALEVLKALGAEGDNSRAEVIRIVEIMKRKAEAARSGCIGGGAPAGTKRKREPLDDERMEGGFHLPYVGPSVTSVKADPVRSPVKATNGMVNSKAIGAGEAPVDGLARKERKQAREKDREKDKGRLPPVGIRARPSQSSSAATRPRGASVSSNAPLTAIPQPPPPRHTATPGSGPSSASSSSASHIHALPPHPTVAVPSSPRIAPGYEAYAIRPPQTPVQPTLVQDQMPEDFSMQYSSEEADRRRYSSSFSESPQGPSLFDPASLSQPSPVSYGTGPSPPNYYQYVPPPQPPQGLPVGYDNAPPMGHPQGIPPPMGSLQLDTTSGPIGQNGLQMSTMVETRYGVQYKPEHEPMQAHEYQPHPQPPPPQQMQMPSQPAWLPPDHRGGAELWQEYKYVG